MVVITKSLIHRLIHFFISNNYEKQKIQSNKLFIEEKLYKKYFSILLYY